MPLFWKYEAEQRALEYDERRIVFRWHKIQHALDSLNKYLRNKQFFTIGMPLLRKMTLLISHIFLISAMWPHFLVHKWVQSIWSVICCAIIRKWLFEDYSNLFFFFFIVW